MLGPEEQHNCLYSEHMQHIATALNAFDQCHGSECNWSSEEEIWHEKLMERIDQEDGYTHHKDLHVEALMNHTNKVV